MFTQMQAKTGIRKHGRIAVLAMLKEYTQLKDKSVFGKIAYDSLTPEQRKNALRAINLIKEKRCGKIKGRTVADGRPQRRYIPSEERTSPTMAFETFIASLMIDAYEKRFLATFDVPGAYLHADWPAHKIMLLKFEGVFVDIICEMDASYKSEVRTENSKKVLYVKLQKALYGCVESALLWYDLYSKTLRKLGFCINPYNKCIANKVINGKQCTIAWYVDDNKVSHEDPAVVEEVIQAIEKHFGDLTVERGPAQTFLGMNFKILDDGAVEINMKDYIQEAIDAFGEPISGTVSSVATKKLFDVNDQVVPLPEKQQDIFHLVVAKLLWVMKRGRPDIELAISFLCTRVSKPTSEDWYKLRRVLIF